MKIRLFHHGDLWAGECTLPEAESHYLVRVLRVRAQAEVLLFNARCGDWRARVSAAHPKATRLVLENCVRPPQPTRRLVLVFAPIKPKRLAALLAMATELGVSHLQPLMTRYTHATMGRDERIKRQLIEAAEQCGRLDVPELYPPLSWTGFAAQQENRPEIMLVCLESGEAQPMRNLLSMPPETPPCVIVIGPEGGFSPEEQAAFLGWKHSQPVSLGGRILRSETAVVAALAQWQGLVGDAEERPNNSI